MVLIAALVGSVARATEPVVPDALAVVVTGAGIPEDFETDIGEPLAFALGRGVEGAFLPLDEVRTQIGYGGPASPGSCLYDDECLRAARGRLGARSFLLVRLAPAAQGLTVTVKQIGRDTFGDVSRSRVVALDVAEAINVATALVGEVTSAQFAVVVVSVNEPGARVEVEGRLLPDGVDRVEVAPGRIKVRVSKEGFSPYEGAHDCRAGETCAVAAALAAFRAAVVLPEPDESGLDDALIASGWSAVGVGALLSVVGVVLGLQADDLQAELEDACEGSVCTTTLNSAKGKVADGEALARDASIFYGVGGAVAAAGLITAVLGHTTSQWAEGTAVEVSPWFGNTPGLSATVRF